MHYFCEGLILAESLAMFSWLSNILSYVGPILLLAIGLGLIIFVHELGHFIAAKIVGIKVETFSLGFGPRLFGFQRGETQYQVCAIVVGGFVKMLGQDDMHPEQRVDDQRSFTNKTVGQRLLVLSSGVVMNLFFASIMFIILFRFTGVFFQRAEVGMVGHGSPARQAGILPGDKILAVDGKAVRDYGELNLRIALAPRDHDIYLTVSRTGHQSPLQIKVRAKTDKKTGIPYIGIVGPVTLEVFEPGDYAGPAGLKEGDRIVALEYDKQRYPVQEYHEFEEIINDRRTNPTNIIAVRDEVELPPVMVRPNMAVGSHVMGMSPPTLIESRVDGSLAEKIGLKPGDVIATFDGRPWPDFLAVVKLCRLDAKEDRDITISVLRAGKQINFQVNLSKGSDKDVPLGIAPSPDYQKLYVADPYPQIYEKKDEYVPLDLPDEEKLEVPPGAKLLTLDGKALANWSDLIDKLQDRAGSRAVLTYSLDGKEERLPFRVPADDSTVWSTHWRFNARFVPKLDEVLVKADSLTGAVYIGMHKTWFWLQGVYLTLTRVAQGSIQGKALAGPLGIADLSIKVTRERGPIHFFYLMAIIGVNLAIVNFLPIPVLDGGHVLFLLIEKLKGSPVSVRIQTVASTISLGALCLFLLFVTYHDILRMFGLG